MTTSPPTNANGNARRKVVAQVMAEETHCHICNVMVDKSLTVAFGKHGKRCAGNGCLGCSPHPMRPTVDEIIPRSKGGSPTERSNCRLAHWKCNRAKSDRVAPAPLPPNPFPLSQIWSGRPWGSTPTPT